MKVSICDRCGTLIEPWPHDGEFYNRVIQVGEDSFSLSTPEGEIFETYDICDECYKSFKKWMKHKGLENK